MKVLHIINNLGSGGAEKLIEESLPLLNQIEGVKADVLLLTDANNVFDTQLNEFAVNLNILPLKKIYSPFNIFYIRKFIIKGKYDIVHAHLFPTNYWTSLASKLIYKNKPEFITTEHSTHNRRREKFYFRFLDRIIYSNYSKIISISQKTQENLIFWINSKQKNLDKFIVIENGINLNKFYDSKPYLKKQINEKLTEESKLLCMVGRFSKQKDQATLIKAMKGLSEDVHLLLIGEGPLKAQNKILVNEIGLGHRIHFLGFRNDVDRIYKTSDIVILSSKWEGFGLAAAEGMATGKPVIASDVTGLREVVKGAGILFSQGDSLELANKINNLIVNEEEYRMVSDKCLKRASKFNIKKMVGSYVNLYLNE
ncbi:glycosyltransferase [Peribacillus butanolivorans]|uniref:glycosyltransferase n=1 Tax=Peribacillus butanolivorans TaxID=421767 RepID=UPI003651A48E